MKALDISITGIRVSDWNRRSAGPRLDPVLYRRNADQRSRPTAMAMRMERMPIGGFEALFGADTHRCDGAAAAGACEQKHVSKFGIHGLQDSPGGPRLGTLADCPNADVITYLLT